MSCRDSSQRNEAKRFQLCLSLVLILHCDIAKIAILDELILFYFEKNEFRVFLVRVGVIIFVQ